MNKTVQIKYSQQFTLSAIYFLMYAGFSTWYPIINQYFMKIGFDSIQTSILASIIPAIILVAQPMWGIAADKMGRKLIFSSVLLIESIFLLAFIQNGNFLYFFFATIILTIFYAPLGMMMDSLTLDFAETNNKIEFGKVRMWASVGFAITASLMGFFTENNLKIVFPIATAFHILAWFIIILHLQLPKQKIVHVQNGKLKSLLNRRILIFFGLVLLLGICTAPMYNFYSVYLDEIGAPQKIIGLAIGLRAFIELPFFFTGNHWIRKFGMKNLILLSAGVTCLRLFLYSFIHNPYLALIVDTLQGISFALFVVAVTEYVNQKFPSQNRATGQSLFNSSHFGAGAIIGNLLTGYLHKPIGINAVYFIVCLLAFLTTVGFYYFFKSEKTTIQAERF